MSEHTNRMIVDYSSRKNPDRERPYGEIADRLNEWRMSSKVLNRELAATSGVPEVTISRVYQGVRFPDHRLLQFLHTKHGVDLNWLLCGDKG